MMMLIYQMMNYQMYFSGDIMGDFKVKQYIFTSKNEDSVIFEIEDNQIMLLTEGDSGERIISAVFEVEDMDGLITLFKIIKDDIVK